MKEQFKYGETEKEILDKIFEFETYCTQRFDSEHRVAMAVYDYVQQMKREYKKTLTEGSELSNVKPNPPESKSAPPPPSPQPYKIKETIEVPKQLISDMLTDMEKNSLSQHNYGWGADWPLTLEEFIEQGKMSKYYYELRKFLPKT